MGWLVALLAGIGFVWLLIVSPRFRIAVIVIAVILVAIVVFWIQADKHREAKSHALISLSQIELQEVRVGKSSWGVVGNVKNNSTHTLTGFTLRITVRDCPENVDCIVIGEGDVDILVTVPPGQLRSFDGFLNLSNMPTPKKPTWNYYLVQTTAKIN
jgi:hypothetical protein